MMAQRGKMKIKKYLVVFLAFFWILSPGIDKSYGNADRSNPNGTQLTINRKLIGPLIDLVKIYRKHPKLTRQNVARYRMDQNCNPGSGSDISISTDTDNQLNSEKVNDLVLNAFIHPEIQKRWGNPPFDVLKCHIEIRGEPDLVKSDFVRVRSISRSGDKTILNVELAGHALEWIAQNEAVVRIEPIFRNRVYNDLATRVTGASRIRDSLVNHIYTRGYTGRGVIVGIIDTGIDWSHEDFIDPETNTSRILYIWDTEDSSGPSPSALFGGSLSGLNYGTVWTKTDIDNGLCTSMDTNGHGTHVSGSAAGNGYATGRYFGMAPNADIIVVKGLDNNGMLFIYEMASALGQPCVVNMSYGPDYPLLYISFVPEPWPADGTSLRAQMIDGWNSTYGPGCVSVKSAGNEGHWNTYNDTSGGLYPYMVGGYHSQASLAGLASSTHYLEVPDYASLWNGMGFGIPDSNDCPYILIGTWYEYPVEITLISPNGNTIGPMVHGNTGIAPTTGDGFCYYNMSNSPAAANGFYYGLIQLRYNTNPAVEPVAGTWRILVDPIPSGTMTGTNIDVWVNDIRYINGLFNISWYPSYVKFTGENVHANYIIDEGASPFLITAGSWATRSLWTDIDGDLNTFLVQSWVNDVSDFSSPGPSRDRRIKPDVAAPGDILISSASTQAVWSNDYLADLFHGVYSGTSMSAAIVSGGVALILEKFPNLDVSGIRNTISAWALHDNATDQRGVNAFGYGKFCILNLNDPPVAVIQKNRESISLDSPDKQVVFDGSQSYDPENFPLTYHFSIETEVLTSESLLKKQADTVNYSFIVNGSSATLDPDPLIEARYRVFLVVNDTITDSSRELSMIEARYFPVHPPINVTLERIENNLVFFTEFINRIGWQNNPANEGEIKMVRIYRKETGQTDDYYQLVASVDGGVFTFDDRGLMADTLYTYKLTSVNLGDIESQPVVVSN